MTGMPMVSVIVPAFNAEHTIGDCLEALLAQDYPPERLEIIAVDNRSTDRTAAVMCQHPVRVVAERRVQSSYAARNTGLAAARAACSASPTPTAFPTGVGRGHGRGSRRR